MVKPTLLVKDGVMSARGMRQERMNREELWRAILEPDGLLSVLKTDEARELTKGDVDRVLRKVA